MRTAPWIIISILILLLVLQRECHHCPDVGNTFTEIHDTTYIPGDTIIKELAPVKPSEPDSVIEQPVPEGIDSAAVALAYYSKVYGYAVLVDDSSMYAGFRYMIEQNRLQWFIPNVANRKPTAIIHNTTVIESVKPKNKYFAGIGVGKSLSSFGLAPSLALLTKKNYLYSIQYDVINREMYLSMYWKIGKK